MHAQDGTLDIAIIGSGRMGQGLALALTRRGRRAAALDRSWDPSVVRQAGLVLLAVPDDSITILSSELAARAAIEPTHVVLHLSGLLDRAALAPLGAAGAGLGSFHPLQSIADPSRAPDELAGAYAGVEGDERALAAAEELAAALGMTAVRIPPGGKPAYHAAATFVSNYTVTLLSIAERLATQAGIPHELAAKLYLPLLRGTIANVAAAGPASALTGPVRRGDVQTVRTHLAALTPEDRELYRQLARTTLKLAAEAGADPTKTTHLEKLLADAT